MSLITAELSKERLQKPLSPLDLPLVTLMSPGLSLLDLPLDASCPALFPVSQMISVMYLSAESPMPASRTERSVCCMSTPGVSMPCLPPPS